MASRHLRKKRAGLALEDVVKARTAAARLGPLEAAFLEWLYTNGARASEPGLAAMSDVDLRAGTVMLHHLKGGLATDPMPMSDRCRRALEAWLSVRAQRLVNAKAQANYLFPSAHPGPCYPCRGEGRLLVKQGKSGEGKLKPCHHCRASGTRWGLTRHEARRIVARIFREASLPAELAFPHVFRHSAATHMLDQQVNPAAIQERLGHKSLTTTLGYLHTTKAAREAVNRTFDGD
jgi:site-specific recombinase XerD